MACEIMYMRDEPQFCYYILEIYPEKLVKKLNIEQKRRRDSTSSSSSSDNSSDYFDCQWNSDFKESQTSSNGYRKRNSSESSDDDSFICFEENGFNETVKEARNTQGTLQEFEYEESFSEEEYEEAECSIFNEDSSEGDDEDSSSIDDSDYDMCTNKKSNKKVRFNLKPEVHIMYKWNFAYRSIRNDYWECCARDHMRFQRRIATTAPILDYVLKSEHRQKIFHERFCQ